ncbi:MULTISPECIES: hypothetical protein [Methylorubrum]|jgi:hypothetical protein|uniref:Uncharacterized protein n=2 Tax=Methylorubrum extorquens TaxID=408 RepID=C7C958_METED|nr:MULTISPECIES: hypothetical protein [Methylobacteriaceae]ABY33079.1 hypothetical protein Mext_4711 [Methylorubrum extorquens PA1]KQO78089.1 hypothetical protein ASF36_13700 [Methylobacterium sp. Leaf90]KQO88367.1 hypothetical protein ASF33_22675 [Methylobacterium sp. Leaf92]KQP86305.1 hypothetical protein ASF55_13970 [Methylobacterium sp. Leaf119]CAX27365.1 protein of unknown function [Methylorubrum extorquens DM4]
MVHLATDCPSGLIVEAAMPALNGESRDRIGQGLRDAYVERCDAQPITDAQVELLLQLRQKERDRRRSA